jgi:hypothetical protein
VRPSRRERGEKKARVGDDCGTRFGPRPKNPNNREFPISTLFLRNTIRPPPPRVNCESLWPRLRGKRGSFRGSADRSGLLPSGRDRKICIRTADCWNAVRTRCRRIRIESRTACRCCTTLNHDTHGCRPSRNVFAKNSFVELMLFWMVTDCPETLIVCGAWYCFARRHIEINENMAERILRLMFIEAFLSMRSFSTRASYRNPCYPQT